MRLRLVFILLCVTSAWCQRGGAGAGAGAPVRGAAGTTGQQRTATQAITDPKLLCTLEGQVLNASTGEPVQRATLTLTGSAGNMGGGPGGGGGRSARTDNEGKFTFDKVQPGTYRLTADRVGFLRQQYGAQTPGGTGAPVNLAQSQTVRNLDIKMTPQGVILGTVFDEEGDPLPRATVAAYRMGKATSMTSARRGGQQSGGSASTNDVGQYRIAALPPGNYVVIASGQGGRGAGGRGGMGGPGGRGQAAAAAVEEALMPTYYPSSLDAAAAAPVQVSPGAEMAGVNIALRKGRLYQVQGKVTGVPAQDAGGVRVNLVPREGGATSMFMGGGSAAAVSQDGSFRVARVQPGSYYLTAQSMGGGGRGGGRGGPGGGGPGAGQVGRTTVDVGAGDVTNVIVTMVDPVPVTGTVKVEGQQTQGTESQAMSLSLTPAEYIPGMPGGGANARVSQGAFKIAAVTPDNYYVSFGGLPEGSYVKSVRMNSQEVIEKGIDLTGARGAVMLDVTLSTKGGSVEGTVVDDGKAAPGSYLMLLADPIRPGQPYLNRSSTSDQDGKFTIKSLAPGDYRLYAFEESQPEIAQDLALIKPFESKAVKVKVSESSTERAELKVLKPGDADRQ